MWNFMWLDIDSSFQTNDSKWHDSFCDSNLTRLDQIMTRKNFRWLWLVRLVTLTRQKWLGHINDSKWLDSSCDSTLTRLEKIIDDSDSKGLWHWLDKNDSGTSLRCSQTWLPDADILQMLNQSQKYAKSLQKIPNKSKQVKCYRFRITEMSNGKKAMLL